MGELSRLICHSLPDGIGPVSTFERRRLWLDHFRVCRLLRIALGQGLLRDGCGTLVTTIVSNGHEFPGHIACDKNPNSDNRVTVNEG